MSDEQELADEWAEALDEQDKAEQSIDAAKDAEPAALEALHAHVVSGDAEVNLENILDIPLTIAMELGTTRITIRNLLQLNQGSVVELDRLAGEPLDVTVNGTLIAHGEVVVINEKFGIRLTDVVSPAERIKNLR